MQGNHSMSSFASGPAVDHTGRQLLITFGAWTAGLRRISDWFLLQAERRQRPKTWTSIFWPSL